MTTPIDFSIAPGKMGAPVRKGRDSWPSNADAKKKLELGEGEVRVKVSFEERKIDDFAIPASSSFDALSSMVTEMTGAESSYQKIFAMGAIIKGERALAALSEAGITPGTTVKVICSSQRAVEEVHRGDESIGKFDGVRGFEEEEEAEWRRHEAEPMYAAPTHGSQDQHGFSRIEPLAMDPLTAAPYTDPPPEDARNLLESLAADRGVQAIMRRRGWRVGLLTELPPNEETGLIGKSGTCLLGLNKNKGEEILLRLRTSDLKGFRPVYAIMETLIHELCHIVHSEHDHKFWALFSELKKEAGSSDWTKHQGSSMGWAVQRSATRRRKAPGNADGHILGSSGGGAGVDDDPRHRAAVAAQGRVSSRSASPPVSENGGTREIEGQVVADAPLDVSIASGSVGLDDGRCGDGKPGMQVDATSQSTSTVVSSRNNDPSDPLPCAAPAPSSPMPIDDDDGGDGVPPAQGAPNVVCHPPDGAGGGGDQAEVPVEAGNVNAGDAHNDGIAMLEGMGFSRGDAQRAMERFHNSVDRAANWLLTGGVADLADGGGSGGGGGGRQEKVEGGEEGGMELEVSGVGGEDQGVSELRGKLEEILGRFVGGIAPDWSGCRASLQLLLTILNNILKHPDEDKYRRIKLANPSFQSKVGRHRGGVEFLESARFRRSADGVFVECARADAAALYIACGVIERAVECLP